MSNGHQPGHPISPVAAGLGDGVHYGYQAVESVLEGLRASLFLRVNRPAAASRGQHAHSAASASRGPTLRTAAGAVSQLPPGGTTGVPGAVSQLPSGGTTGVPGAVTGELLRLFVEALDMAGEAAQEVARALAYPHHGGDHQEVTLDEVEVVQGSNGVFTPGSFTVWNTGHAALTDVTFSRTDLIGPSPIPADKVVFDPPKIKKIEPRTGVTVFVTVAEGTQVTGENRGVITADPGGTVLLIVRRSR